MRVSISSKRALPLVRLATCLLLTSCGEVEKSPPKVAERITRLRGECEYPEPEIQHLARDPYPWEGDYINGHKRITKEFFRCRGCALRQPRLISDDEYARDCGGIMTHGLPLFDGEEGVYPVLIELLNYLQQETGERIVITCGHRCPAHNTYADNSPFNAHSKHMVGAEVDFYIEGMEERPQEVIDLLLAYYQDHSEASYRNFQRYTKDDANTTTPPWYNKEVFIKLYQSNEGRDLDNDHPYPYVGILVRYDRHRENWVAYTWKEAHTNYQRN